MSVSSKQTVMEDIRGHAKRSRTGLLLLLWRLLCLAQAQRECFACALLGWIELKMHPCLHPCAEAEQSRMNCRRIDWGHSICGPRRVKSKGISNTEKGGSGVEVTTQHRCTQRIDRSLIINELPAKVLPRSSWTVFKTCSTLVTRLQFEYDGFLFDRPGT